MKRLGINLINSLIISSMFLIIGCSSTKFRDIEPKDYVFENDYIQTKWSNFMSLDDCSKIKHLDSIFRPILVEKSRVWNNPNLTEVLMIDTNLITGSRLPKENYYYWVFREIQSLTNLGPSVSLQYFGYMGIVNLQLNPAYFAGDSLRVFNEDIKNWKDSLGCD